MIPERLAERLRSPRAPEIAALVALILSLPTLRLGWILDDHLMPAHARAELPPWERFWFVTGPDGVALGREQGWLGWWAGDDFTARFMRPLSSLLHSLDFWLWPEAAWLMHLENVLLYCLAVWLVARLVQRVHGPGLVAGVAALVFAFDETHAATVAWITGRNSTLALVFGVAALHAHLRWRGIGELTPVGRGELRWPVLAVGCFALALASAEAGMCAFGYVVAWSLVHERGPWVRRLLPTLPYLGVLVVWRVIYVAVGYGARDSSVYLDVGAHPEVAALNLLRYPPALGLAQLSLPISDLLVVAPWTWVVLAPIFGLLVWAIAPLIREQPRARSWLLGMLFAALPFAATVPTARLLVILGVGGAPLIGVCLDAWRTPGALVGRGRRALVGVMLIANLWLAPLAYVAVALTSDGLEQPHRTLTERVPEDAKVVVIVNLAVEISALYPKAMRETAGGRWPDHVYLLFSGRDAVAVARVDRRTLELRSEAGWGAKTLNRLTRDWTRGFSVGDRVELAEAAVEVLALTPDDRPAAIRVTFARDLDEVVLLGFGIDIEGGEGGEGLVRWQPQVGDRARFRAGYR